MSFFGLFSDCSQAGGQPGPVQCRLPDCSDGAEDEVFVPQHKVVVNGRAEESYAPGGSQYAVPHRSHSVFLPPAVQAIHHWDARRNTQPTQATQASQPSSRAGSVAGSSPRRTHDGYPAGVSTAGTVPGTPELEFRVPRQELVFNKGKIPESWPEQDEARDGVRELPKDFPPGRPKPHRDCCEGGLPSCLEPDVADERAEQRP